MPGTFLTLEQTNMPSAWMLTFEKLFWLKKVELRSKQGWRAEQGVRLERFHFELRGLKLCIQMAIPLHTGFHNQELAVQFFNKTQPFKF